METLDLHGLRHHEVRALAENFILIHELPVRIITGNSLPMKQIVWEVVGQHSLYWEYESFVNLGAIVVRDRSI